MKIKLSELKGLKKKKKKKRETIQVLGRPLEPGKEDI